VSGGVRWEVIGENYRYPTDLYTGQAGILAFLAEADRVKPSADLASVLNDGGRDTRSHPVPRRYSPAPGT
jgi:hypothetical protein